MKDMLTLLQDRAQGMKEDLWPWLEKHKVPHELNVRVRNAMNELLDELDVLDDYRD